VEFAGIVLVNGAGEASSGPGKVDPTLRQPRLRLEHGLRDTDAGPERGSVVQGQIEASDQPGVDVNCEAENETPDELPGDLVNDDQIHGGVVNLHDVERTR